MKTRDFWNRNINPITGFKQNREIAKKPIKLIREVLTTEGLNLVEFKGDKMLNDWEKQNNE